MKKTRCLFKNTTFRGLRAINVFLNGDFQGFSSISRFFHYDHGIHRKKLAVLKKNFMKKHGPKQILWRNFWIFFEKKNRNFFENFLVWELFIRRQNAGKKKIFFEKNHDPDFGQNFGFYFCKGIVLFQKFSIFLNFFSIFMTQRTVLEPSELDPALSPHYERA